MFAYAFVWAVLVVSAVHFLKFPGSVPNFVEVSGGGTLLDALPAFTPDATYERLAAYGEAGRQNYSFRNMTVDVMLPLSVLPFLFILMMSALRGVAISRSLRLLLLSVPFLYVIFDLLENALVLRLLAGYPERLDLLATMLPYVTTIKRGASLIAFGLPVGLFVFRFIRTRSQKMEVST
jgi:hypothetical protein